MAKKPHNWGKGYARRQQEERRIREQRALQFKPKEGRRMEKQKGPKVRGDMLGEAILEAELQQERQKSEQYRKAWEAEKTTANSYLAGWNTARGQLRKRERAAFTTGALLGIPTGALLLIVWTVLTQGWVFS